MHDSHREAREELFAGEADYGYELTGRAEHEDFMRGSEDMERRAMRMEAEREARMEAYWEMLGDSDEEVAESLRLEGLDDDDVEEDDDSEDIDDEDEEDEDEDGDDMDEDE